MIVGVVVGVVVAVVVVGVGIVGGVVFVVGVGVGVGVSVGVVVGTRQRSDECCLEGRRAHIPAALDLWVWLCSSGRWHRTPCSFLEADHGPSVHGICVR